MKPTSSINWRHAGDPSRDREEGDACITYFQDDSLTQQHFTEDADINVLAARFGLTHPDQLPLAPNPAYFADLSDTPDLRTVMDLVLDARVKFMALPPKLRARFNNSPAVLWAFVNDPENADESIRLGLLRAPEPPATTPPSEPSSGEGVI